MTDTIEVTTQGITASGYIAWGVIGLLAFFIYMKYGHSKVKIAVKKTVGNRRRKKR